MTFTQQDAYWSQSDCLRYTVSKTFGPPGIRYLAWREGVRDTLGCFKTAAAAMDACREDAGERAAA